VESGLILPGTVNIRSRAAARRCAGPSRRKEDLKRNGIFLALGVFLISAFCLFATGPQGAPQAASGVAPQAISGVRAWEEKVVIPTYLAGPAELNPLFFFGRSSQGAQGPIMFVPNTPS
jgi:hypothetical protein